LQCPICGATAAGGYALGDSTVVVCPQCGGYRLAGTVITLFEKGTLRKPDPASFRDLVKAKRGASTEYPVITQYDLGG
jgi:Zn-finger nucleic acid-binding protein